MNKLKRQIVINDISFYVPERGQVGVVLSAVLLCLKPGLLQVDYVVLIDHSVEGLGHFTT